MTPLPTLIDYNIQFLETILASDESIIKEIPLICTFYDPNTKKIKTIRELSEEYVKQPIAGRETLTYFVDYQIKNGDLDNINLEELSKEEQTNILLLIARQLKRLMTRLYIYLSASVANLSYSDKIGGSININEIIEILNKELSFLRKNKGIIDELAPNWTNYISNETAGIELLEQPNNPTRLFEFNAEENLGLNSTDPFYVLYRFANYSITEILRNHNSRYKNATDEERKTMDKLLSKIETQLEDPDQEETRKIT